MLSKIKAYGVGFRTAYREARQRGEGRVSSLLMALIIVGEISSALDDADE